MQVLYALHELFYKVFGDVNLQRFVALVPHVLVQTYPGHVLLNQVDIFGTLKVVVNLADVWVLKLFHALNFALYGSLLIKVI